jgi:hypothetical protein
VDAPRAPPFVIGSSCTPGYFKNFDHRWGLSRFRQLGISLYDRSDKLGSACGIEWVPEPLLVGIMLATPDTAKITFAVCMWAIRRKWATFALSGPLLDMAATLWPRFWHPTHS